MPRPMLHRQENQTYSTLSLSKPKQADMSKLQDKMQIDRRLRQNRSQEYLKMIKRLDAGGHAMNAKQVKEIISGIQNEFPEIDLGGVFIGTIARCYLGEPYEVHTLDVAGNIITHYKHGESLPDGMEKGRALALGNYEFVEIYTDCCRAICSDGSVAVVKS